MRRLELQSPDVLHVIVINPFARAPDDLMRRAEREAVLDLHVVGVEIERCAVARRLALRVIVVSLDHQLRRVSRVLPTPQHVCARERDVRHAEHVLFGVVDVTLRCPAVASVRPVGAHTALRLFQSVVRARPVLQLEGVALERFPVDAVRAVGAERAAIARAGRILLVAGPGAHHRALSVRRRARNDVDHAVHGIRAPQRRARSADHLDALDVLHHDVLRVIEHAGEQR